MSEHWREIDPRAWRAVPHVKGRLATQADVQSGRATFCIEEDEPATPHPIPLPHCAIWNKPDGSTVNGVIIQAEKVRGRILVGFRPMSGGGEVATIYEFILASDPSAFPK